MSKFINFVLLGLILSATLSAESSTKKEKVYLHFLKASKKNAILRLKGLSDKKLVTLLRTIQDEALINDRDVWSFAGTVFNELSIRVWSKNNKKEHEGFRQCIMHHSKTAVARSAYALETAGLFDKKRNKVFHPYPFSSVSKKLIEKWNKSSTDKSLDDYIFSYMSKSTIKELKDHSVKYLSPSQHGKYRVTFSKGRVRIGNEVPYNDVYIYALGIIKNKPVLLAGLKSKGRFQHTSFFAGAPVLSVGEFMIVNEKFISVQASSGHYHPTKEHAQALIEHLKDENRLGNHAASKIKVIKHK